jgi:hypothetical protein
MLNVVCVLRTGGKVGYDATWVEKLKRGIEKNLTLPYQFVCFSDCNLSVPTIPLDSTDHGFWSKMQMFKPNLFNGPVLYLDLDTVVCQNIDSMIARLQDQSFVMWNEADKNIHSSALMFWQGDHSYLWSLYKSQPLCYWESLYSAPPLYGDQAIISENTKHSILTDHCPSEWFHIASYKDNQRNLDSVKLLMFRKVSQKPSTMPDHPLVQQHWC